MYWLYYIMPDRRLTAVCNKFAIHLGFANKAVAECEARALSVSTKPEYFGYPITVDENPKLHNTRDGKPV